MGFRIGLPEADPKRLNAVGPRDNGATSQPGQLEALRNGHFEGEVELPVVVLCSEV